MSTEDACTSSDQIWINRKVIPGSTIERLARLLIADRKMFTGLSYWFWHRTVEKH